MSALTVGRRYDFHLADGTIYPAATLIAIEDGDYVIEALIPVSGGSGRVGHVYIPTSEFDRAEEVSK